MEKIVDFLVKLKNNNIKSDVNVSVNFDVGTEEEEPEEETPKEETPEEPKGEE